ncbi:hypothetical protein [Daejeonella sp. H1SJ63]|uniref:hypothetical protein n=1 Tax=Daejeonella sp. H1SJ63 TaxID=3034145 RepID=UPI0023EBB964|nr:hypothetical protein [Daejeonella sp. H1SJ63]
MNFKFTSILAITAIITFSAGCQKDETISSVNELSAVAEVSATGGAYTNIFEGKTDNGNGTYTYTWSMQNNTGSQNLSHWVMDLGTCVTIDDVVSAAQGADLNNMSAVEVLWQADPSLSNANLTGCNITVPVFKFGQGTPNATTKVYYSITISKNVGTADVTGYYKSGKITGCGSFIFTGLGCEIVEEVSYSYSQGFWFAKPQTVWPGDGTITLGNKVYTQAEGKAIWDSSNKKGLADSKAAFTQAAAIKLSAGLGLVKPSASVWADVAIVDAYLATLNKLTPTYLPTGNAAAKAAAGRISTWIQANHVDTTFGN